MTDGVVGDDWAEIPPPRNWDSVLNDTFPEGRLVAVADPMHDMYRKGGVVKEINWETRKIVVYFVESSQELEFSPSQLLDDTGGR